MSGPTAVPITENVPVKRGQGYGLTRTYRATFPDAMQERKLRVDINRNAYDHQSHYRVLAWTDGSGWTLVTEILPEAPDMVTNPSYVLWDNSKPGARQECVKAVESIASRLVDEALAILA
jgi:hypothetical protein